MVELLAAILRRHLMYRISSRSRPELKCLRSPGESYSHWIGLSVEEILSRWVRYHVGEEALKSLSADEVRTLFEHLDGQFS